MKLKIDLTNPRHIVAAAAFFNSLAGVAPGVNLTMEREAPKPARIRRATKAALAQEKLDAAEAGKAELEHEEAHVEKMPNKEIIKGAAALHESLDESAATLEILQDLVPKLSKASKENIPKMRDKLIELGAKRVSSLTSDKYQEFYAFLKTLDNAGA